MKKSSKESDPQLSLGLSFKDLRLVEYARYRISKTLIMLDEVSFWRLPVLYFMICIDLTVGYWLYFSVIRSGLLPPFIPILYYAPQVDTITASNDILGLYFFLIALHILLVYVASKLFYRLRPLSVLVLLGCILTTLLFTVTIYKSASLTLP